MKNISIFILTVSLLAPALLPAQYKSLHNEKKLEKFDVWYYGEVTFKDGKTMECEFTFNPLVPEGILKINYLVKKPPGRSLR
jgi:hypothetical protein